MNDTTTRKILVTSALPYANGPLHLGHLLEYIQTDVWVRFQRLRGHRCCYICADDAHGSPIMLKARELGISPEELIAKVSREHQADFEQFLISFDNYYSTHSPENRELAATIYQSLQANGFIAKQEIRQAYDEEAEMFLPDRFIKGTCPRCGADDQYGDCCEACGATYSPRDLRNAVSVLSNKPPVERASEHYFFKLREFEGALKQWLSGRHIQPAIRNKLDEWFETGLQDWDISRDEPYFGFEIPDHPGKYFYVWLDAPIGYMASFQNYCKRNGVDFDHYWNADSPTELHHFIGKDIAYFHTLFWPAMLEGAGFRKPTAIHCHGFITINKQKMSKSRGTFITAAAYLHHLSPEYLRYYFAAKLNSGIEDIDLNLEDFVQRVNSDLVGKLVNIASRCSRFIAERFNHRIICGDKPMSHRLLKDITAARTAVAALYEDCEYAAAMREIMRLADDTNRYIDQHKPWEMVKNDNAGDDLHEVCSIGIIAFAYLTLYLKPVLPAFADNAEQFLNLEFARWDEDLFPSSAHEIRPFKPLLKRINTADVAAVLEEAKQTVKAPEQTQADTISYADFEKLDLRVARVADAETIDGADKLLRLSLDDGADVHTVLAGIKSSYAPADLIGRHVVFVRNLKPKKTRFGTSSGMVLAAGDGPLFLLAPDEGAEPGMKVK